ncbi:hypothetical protein HR11_05190 [Porphyromonas macacae]|uniref:LiaI-LiaF-like domain-containing protein n=1 Tax=Porphyromonas macacae TaxID=28115 RepID=UPI00052DEF51|nr:DUF5668 domain-containing protein [Porphyromonas macacae]KGN99630.1 hypothetical protein HR11_05190 [Porphyromonas macacae]
MRNINKRSSGSNRHSNAPALILIFAGIFFLLKKMNLISPDFSYVFLSWPIFILISGLWFLISGKKKTGIILSFVGIYFLVPRILLLYPGLLPNIDAHEIHNLWPLVLIIIGAAMLIRSRKLNRDILINEEHIKGDTGYKTERGKMASDFSQGYFHKECIFSGSEYILLSTSLYGGNVLVLFGGIKLDLRKVQIPPGQEVELKINCYFGGVEMFLPDDCSLDIRSQTLFGGIEDDRRYPVSEEKGGRLIITGNVIFGGMHFL